MAVKTKAILQNLQSKLAAHGALKAVMIGEPSDPPDSPTAALILSRYEITSTTLNSTIERRTITIRIYHRAFTEPRGDIEFLLDDIVTEIIEDIFGDFDLGANVRNVEPLATGVAFGYQQVGNVMYRIADINLAVIVDDSATFTA